MPDLTVPTEIRNQLGFKALYMLGAYHIFADGESALVFKIRGCKQYRGIRIELNGMDTYDITFLNWRKNEIVDQQTVTGVYADMMHEIIETNTGLRTSL